MGINIVREEILLKGYASLTDIRKFIPCGWEKARSIYDDIVDQVNAEGKRVIAKGVKASRLCDYVGLTHREILQFAEREKATAGTVTNKNISK